jgi:hypothetical protein
LDNNDHMIKSIMKMLTKQVWQEKLGCYRCYTMNTNF